MKYRRVGPYSFGCCWRPSSGRSIRWLLPSHWPRRLRRLSPPRSAEGQQRPLPLPPPVVARLDWALVSVVCDCPACAVALPDVALVGSVVVPASTAGASVLVELPEPLPAGLFTASPATVAPVGHGAVPVWVS